MSKAWVVPKDKRQLFDGAQTGSQIEGSIIFKGVSQERMKATVTKTGRAKNGRWYECDLTLFGVDLGTETFLVREDANA